MTTPMRAIVLTVSIWVLFAPAPARGGYDIAHIVEMTCDPGGPLIVTDDWKAPEDRDRVVTEPGEVIGCPRVGAASYQLAAARADGCPATAHLAAYFTVGEVDGGDVSCIESGAPDVSPVMAIRTDRRGAIAVAGVATADVPGAALIPIDRERARRLGASGAFRFFTLPMSEQRLCREIGVSIPRRLRLVDATDEGTSSRPLTALCRARSLPVAAMPLWIMELAARLGRLTGALA